MMTNQRIRTREDAVEMAGRIVDRYIEGSRDSSLGKLEDGGSALFLRRADSETAVPLITSCSGAEWRGQAVATLADMLWQKRECWNENLPEL